MNTSESEDYMKELIIVNCEHEGNQNAIVLKASITRETGLFAIEQFDKDAIEITQEQALRLAASILANHDEIVTTEEYYNS